MNVGKAKATIAIGADSKQLDKDLAAARKKLKGFKDGAKKLGKGLLGGGKMLAGGALAGVGFAAAGGIADMVGDVFSMEKALTRFQIASGKSSAEIQKMRSSILDVSRATGVGASDILAGAQTYVDLTGDVAGAEKAMSSFARIAQASGATVSDVAQATAAMQMSGKLAAEEIEAVWSGLITQGKAGAVSVKDMAGELATLMPMMAKFAGGTGANGIRDMGAAFQVVRRGAGSASEASTKLQSLVGSLIKSSPKLAKAGIKVFKWDAKTKKRELIGFRDIIGQLAKKNFDAEKLGKVLGTDKESLQALDMLTKEIALYDELKQAGQDVGSVQRDLTTYQMSTAGKLEQAFNAAKLAVADAFTPERVTAFVDALVKILNLIPQIVSGVEAIVGSMDVRRKGGEVLGKQVAQTYAGKSVGEQRAKAEEMRRKAMTLEEGSGEYWAAVTASRELMGMSDRWNQPQQGGPRLDEQKLAAAIAGALERAKTTTTVKVGAEPVVKAHGNAMAHRTRPGGH